MIPQTAIYIIAGVALVGFVVYLFVKQRHVFKIKNKQKVETPEAEAPTAAAASADVKKAEIVDKETGEITTVEFEKISTEGELNALVVDHKTRCFGLRKVELQPGKDYGRQRTYFQAKEPVYFLERLLTGEIRAKIPPENIKETPTELYEAIQTAEDVDEVFGWRNQGENFKLLIWVIAAIVAMVISLFVLSYKGGA